MRKGRHLVLALIGAALFTWVVARVGLPAILQQLKAMRLALPILLTLSVCRLLLQTTVWSAALKGEGISVAYERLIGIRLASQAMGYLTFLGAVLSEPLKIKLLGTPTESTIKATFLDSGVYWFTSVLVAIIGCPCAASLVAHDAHYAGTALAITLLSFVLFLIARREPILSSLVRVLGRRCPSWLAHGEALERSIRNYRRQQPALVGRMFWIDVVCQLLTVSEVAVVLWSLRVPIHLATVLAIEGITRALKMVSGWIPARLGADEGGAMSAFLAAGLSPVLGLALALTRRLRDLLWALIGLAWLVWRSPGVTGHEPLKETYGITP
jgi:Lysylphosphatidylglycerol synthase TM region